jgi:hypothetical protein
VEAAEEEEEEAGTADLVEIQAVYSSSQRSKKM